MQQTSKEKKNKQIGGIISVGAHVLVILLFLFMVAWRAPDPPLPEIGIELNFGLDDAGSGEEQPEPTTSPAESESEEEASPDGLEDEPEEDTEDQILDSEPIIPTDQTTDEPIDPVNNTQDSPEQIEDKQQTEGKKEPIKEKEVKEKEIPKMTYPSNDEKKKDDIANQGDQENATGDQGDESAILDDRADYGKNKGSGNGSGEGSSFQMSGWIWDYKPDPDYPKSLNQSGKIVFQVVIDEKGNIFRVIMKENSVSTTLAKIYEDEVWKLTFHKTAGSSAEAASTGTITFVIKAR